MLGINGWEFLILIVLAVVILGPERLPEYAAKLAQGVRKLRVMAEGAKVTLKDQLGPEYQDINWRQYDPRQYDHRRIVREALAEPLDYVSQPFKELADEARTVRDDVVSVKDTAREVLANHGSAPVAPAVVGAAVTGSAVMGAVGSMVPSGRASYWDAEAT